MYLKCIKLSCHFEFNRLHYTVIQKRTIKIFWINFKLLKWETVKIFAKIKI